MVKVNMNEENFDLIHSSDYQLSHSYGSDWKEKGDYAEIEIYDYYSLLKSFEVHNIKDIKRVNKEIEEFGFVLIY